MNEQKDGGRTFGLAVVEDAGRDLLDIHDRFLSGKTVDDQAQRRIFMAECFGAAAYERCQFADAAPAAMARALFLALMDPTHPDLDYLRGNATAAIDRQDTPHARAMCASGMQEGV